MCNFFSGIITKSGVLFDLDNDSHEEIIKKHKFNDNTKSPDFVRVELTPKDGNPFNHTKENWELNTDQDYTPEWYSPKFAEKEMREALKQLIKVRFIINNDSWKEITDKRIFVLKSKIKAVRCRVVAWENSSVEARENSSVEARENSSILIPNYYNNKVNIKSVHDCASVKDIANNKIIVANKDFKMEQFKEVK